MKRIIAVLFAVIIALCIMSACGRMPRGDGKIKIVTTVFPIYDWTCRLTKGASDIDVAYLLRSGVDMHSFQPAVDDIINVSTADIVVYVGGESDEWIDDTLKEAVNKNIRTVNLINLLGKSAKKEEVVEGMQDGADDDEIDEHIWLSPDNAKKLVTAISDSLSHIDPDNSGLYSRNASDYLKKLDELKGKFKKAVERAKYDTVVFADRFPFRYLFDDLGLNYFAAFAGCSAETEADFDTIIFLADKIDELGVKSIMQTETADGSIAKTIREATKLKNQRILTLKSMQSVTSNEVKSGVTYISIMEENLNVLTEALGKE